MLCVWAQQQRSGGVAWYGVAATRPLLHLIREWGVPVLISTALLHVEYCVAYFAVGRKQGNITLLYRFPSSTHMHEEETNNSKYFHEQTYSLMRRPSHRDSLTVTFVIPTPRQSTSPGRRFYSLKNVYRTLFLQLMTAVTVFLRLSCSWLGLLFDFFSFSGAEEGRREARHVSDILPSVLKWHVGVACSLIIFYISLSLSKVIDSRYYW